VITDFRDKNALMVLCAFRISFISKKNENVRRNLNTFSSFRYERRKEGDLRLQIFSLPTLIPHKKLDRYISIIANLIFFVNFR
jgi:hypothetical protein